MQIFVLGKNPNNSVSEIPIQVGGDTVSRNHARVYFDGVDFYIEDLGSTNGTFINGNQIHIKTLVLPTDRVTLGKSFVFDVETLKSQLFIAEPSVSKSFSNVEQRNFPNDSSITRDDVEFASWGQRFLAIIVDGVILNIVYYLLLLVVGLFTVTKTVAEIEYDPWVTEEEIVSNSMFDLFSNSIGALLIVMVFMIAFSVFYFGWFVSTKGGTPGKLLVKIKIVNEETCQNISWINALGRQLATGLSSFILYIGFLMPLWDDKKRALHDRVAGTVVIKTQV